MLHPCENEEPGKVREYLFVFAKRIYIIFSIGVANMFFASGQAIGAPIGGLIADTIGWRWYVHIPPDQGGSHC